MKVVITGAAGFLGKKLSHRLAGNVTLTGRSGKPEAITKVTLFDVVEPEAKKTSASPRPPATSPINP